MKIINFFEYNLGIVAVVVLVVFLYLVFLINKRRKDKFLHDKETTRGK
jgi:hypothetical protein